VLADENYRLAIANEYKIKSEEENSQWREIIRSTKTNIIQDSCNKTSN